MVGGCEPLLRRDSRRSGSGRARPLGHRARGLPGPGVALDGAADPKRRALGRGLDALLPAAPAQRSPAYGEGAVFTCPLEKIVPQKGQPRQHFDPQKLDELAASIREHGLVEPLVVRRMPDGDRLELIAGERRWRALQRAGVREALVVVKDVSAKNAFELALIENVQREDLNPLELAEAYDRLLREHGYTQDVLAQRVGKDRTTIANSLRLLKLPPRVRAKVIAAELTEKGTRARSSARSTPRSSSSSPRRCCAGA